MEKKSLQRLHCQIENGIIITRTVDLPDGEYYIDIKPVGARSGQQNNYYWRIIDILSEELGYTKKEMHKTIKDHFGIQSTKLMEQKEFSNFLEELIRWCAIELNVVIPDP